MLVLGILMAIAIPLIGGVREAANNTKCRSNLKQLHTAIIAYATGNKERLPNLVGSANLQSLINGGYIDADTKLGDCPGSPAKERGSDSAYQSGSKLDGIKRLSALKSDDIMLADATDTYHKSGRNVILLDGRFRQGKGVRITLSTGDIEDLNQELLVAYDGGLLERIGAMRQLLERGADVNMIVDESTGRRLIHKAVVAIQHDVVELLLSYDELNIDFQDEEHGYTTVHFAVYTDSAIMRDLLEKNPNLALTDNNGRTALEFAQEALASATDFRYRRRLGPIVRMLEEKMNQ